MQFRSRRSVDVMTHYILGSTYSNGEWDDQKRCFEFLGYRLTLSTPPIMGGDSTLAGVWAWKTTGGDL